MAATNNWRVDTPALNVQYNAPNGFWILPNNGTNMTIQWNAFKADGSGAATMNVTLFNVNQPANTNQSSLGFTGVNGATFTTSNGNNGTQNKGFGFKITGGTLPDHCLISFSAYTGSAYPLYRLRRSGAWTKLDGSKILIRRSGVWVQVNQVAVRRSGVWTDPS